MIGVDVSFLMVQYKDGNGRWHEETLSKNPTTYDGIEMSGVDDRYGWIECGKNSFCFDPDWKQLIVRGRLGESEGREYFEEVILQEGE